MQDEKLLKSGIYCIENLITNKKYIGQSIDIENRWKKHITELNNQYHHNDYLQKAWNKYGKNNFGFYVLEYCNKEELNQKEDYYIQKYNTMDRKYGYNLKSGGQDHNFQTEEVKRKISESNKKAYQNSNLKDIRKIDALNQWADPKIKEKITGENNGMYGKHHTEEAKKAMSEKKKGRLSPKRDLTPVYCIELNKTYECAAVAARELGIQSGCILLVCRGERKTTGGYHWKFILENNIS